MRSPPKLSHRELLAIAGVRDGGGDGARLSGGDGSGGHGARHAESVGEGRQSERPRLGGPASRHGSHMSPPRSNGTGGVVPVGGGRPASLGPREEPGGEANEGGGEVR